MESLAGLIPRVWCWADLWARIRAEVAEGPTSLSEAAAGAVFGEAIRQARHAGELTAIASAIDWPGYRRRLRARFADWTTEERPVRAMHADEPVMAAEWAAFVRYRNLLRKLGAEDEPGLAAWASRRLLQRPPAPLAAFAQVTFLDWESPTPAHWRVLGHAVRRARSVRVTMAWEGDEPSAPLYEATAPIRARLLEQGFVETPVRPEIWRPAGLRELEQALFRRSEVQRGRRDRPGPVRSAVRRRARAPPGCWPARSATGSTGAPIPRTSWSCSGDGMSRRRSRWRSLRDWGIPVHADAARPLGGEPAVAALLLAIGLPVDDWATDRLIRLLAQRAGAARAGRARTRCRWRRPRR